MFENSTPSPSLAVKNPRSSKINGNDVTLFQFRLFLPQYGSNTTATLEDDVTTTSWDNHSADYSDDVGSCASAVTIPYLDYTQSAPVLYVFVILYVIVMTLSTLGNLMVIWTVYSSKRMRTVTNYYIVNLAVCDLLVGAVVMPLKLAEYTAPCEWNVIFSDGVCAFLYFILPVFVFASALTLVAISVERFIAIVYPLNAKVFATMSRTRRIIGVTWLISTFVSIPYLHCQSYAFSIGSHLGSVSRRICNDRFDEIDLLLFPADTVPVQTVENDIDSDPHHSNVTAAGAATAIVVASMPPMGGFRKIFFMFLFIGMYVTPAAIILYTCVHMSIRLLVQSPAELRGNQHGCRANIKNKLESNKRKIVRVIIAVATSFLVSWAPFYLVSFISQAQTKSFLRRSNFLFTMLTTQLCGFVNSCINPFIYNCMCDNFRTSFRRIFFKLCCGRGRGGGDIGGGSRLSYVGEFEAGGEGQGGGGQRGVALTLTRRQWSGVGESMYGSGGGAVGGRQSWRTSAFYCKGRQQERTTK